MIMSEKEVSFDEWFNEKDTKCALLLSNRQCPVRDCRECEFETEAKNAWDFKEKQISSLKKELEGEISKSKKATSKAESKSFKEYRYDKIEKYITREFGFENFLNVLEKMPGIKKEIEDLKNRDINRMFCKAMEKLSQAEKIAREACEILAQSDLRKVYNDSHEFLARDDVRKFLEVGGK